MKEHQPVSQQYSELLVNTGTLAQQQCDVGPSVRRRTVYGDATWMVSLRLDLALSLMASQKLIPES